MTDKDDKEDQVKIECEDEVFPDTCMPVENFSEAAKQLAPVFKDL